MVAPRSPWEASSCSDSGGFTSRAWIPNSPIRSRLSVSNETLGRVSSARLSRAACSSRWAASSSSNAGS